MDYEILAQDYFNEANILKNYIKKLKQLEKMDSDDLNFRYRIKTLYEMYLELKNTGEHLMHKFEVISSEKK